jgi:tape measure domain-containing protein
MSGPLDDLDFSIVIDLAGAPEQLRQLNTSIENLGKLANAVVPSTAALANSVRGIDFSSTTAGAESLYQVALAAAQSADVMDTASTAMHALDSSLTTLALSTRYSATAFGVFGSAVNSLVGGIRLGQDSLFKMGGALRRVSGGAFHFAHILHAAAFAGDLLVTALSMLAIPLKIVWTLGTALFRLLGPIMSMGFAIGKLWFAVTGWIGVLKVLGTWLGALPPKLRLVVGGLLALGASGKVGAFGLRIFTSGVAAVAGAVKLAANGLRFLYLPIQAIRNPAAAASTALGLMGAAMSAAGSAAFSAGSRLTRLTRSVASLAASPIRAAINGFKSLGSEVMRLGPQIAAVGTMAAMAWGTKVAVATEKNIAVFGVMLKDMGQGAAVVKSLQNTQAAKLFDNQELLDSGRLLYKAGVSAADVAGKTNQLATIAAATSTDLGDLARIYQQGANTGSFGQDKINQLAERGIDIYHALEASTGKSGAALAAMISNGSIGVAEMDAALAHLTEGNGIYAGSLEAMATTTAGKMTTLKNNIGQALGQVMGVALAVLAPFGTALVTLSEGLSSAFESVREPLIYAATAVAWYFGNLLTIGKFAWLSVALFAVTAFNDIAYWFTDKLPAYMTWFGQNWKQLFVDAGTLVVTVFSNIATNIKNAMAAIWDYIASGGTSSLQFAFTPLLDGFKATVAQLPDIPDRAMTDLEKSLTTQTEQLGTTLADNFDAMLAENQQKLGTPPEIKPGGANAAGESGGGAESTKKAGNKAAENKALGVRSEEGQNLIAQFAKVRESDTAKKAANAQINSEKHLAKLQRDVEQGKPVAGKAWG